jgi:hypothetical protein
LLFIGAQLLLVGAVTYLSGGSLQFFGISIISPAMQLILIGNKLLKAKRQKK